MSWTTKLDLQSARAIELYGHGHITLPKSSFEQLIRLEDQSRRKRELLLFTESYSIGKTKYSIMGLLSKPDKKEESFFDITYRRASVSESPKTVIKAETVLEKLAGLKGNVKIFCRTTFSYPLNEVVCIIPLPLSIGDGSNEIFDEIRGIRLTKYRGEDLLYSAVIDCTNAGKRSKRTSEELNLSVSFEYKSSLQEDLPQDSLRKATEIARKFATPKETT
ncbi:hypothetical protein HYR54_06065 [Candidatus Acetothermia bacterium]|nr:hypothetical protein [Candidatus Acetothermia bacterium]